MESRAYVDVCGRKAPICLGWHDHANAEKYPRRILPLEVLVIHGQLLKSTHTFQKRESSGIGVGMSPLKSMTRIERPLWIPHDHLASMWSPNSRVGVCVGVSAKSDST